MQVYKRWVKLHGNHGQVIIAQTVVDGGAMQNTMCASRWDQWKRRMTPKRTSEVMLRVADNHKIRSEGCWVGEVTVANVTKTQSFDIFKSNGAFKVILGKPWLQAVKAMHDYEVDELTIEEEARQSP
ncbi:hypothetical protein JB92DRAFT_3291275 [Gautieria morchelliformis]|nr:hypothetical protein JB92DRAFT_3291275 [Gautieria morchelliformis]